MMLSPDHTSLGKTSGLSVTNQYNVRARRPYDAHLGEAEPEPQSRICGERGHGSDRFVSGAQLLCECCRPTAM